MKEEIFKGTRIGKTYIFDKETKQTITLDSIMPVKIIRSSPNSEEPSDISFEDVWGENGMIVAKNEGICPHFGDKLEYKTYTFVCKEEQLKSVSYWIERNLGSDSISKVKKIDGDLNLIAIRGNYMCW